MLKAILAVLVIIVVIVAIYYATSTSGFSSGVVLPNNATLSSILANGSTNYLILAQLVNRDFYNSTNTLQVNYSGGDIYSGSLGGGNNTNIYNYSYTKYYRNISFTARKLITNGSNPTKSNFMFIGLNGSNSSYSSSYFCQGTNSSSVSYSCNSTASAVPDMMYYLFEIQTRPDINVSSLGQRNYSGMPCTLLTGTGSLPVSQPPENITFTTCISSIYNIPLNITETGVSLNNTVDTGLPSNIISFSINLHEISISTNVTNSTIAKLLK
jgi:hypothetical protein